MSDKKLIKLITNDSNAIFDNQFNSEIIINKNSEIALHSLSMVREAVKFVVEVGTDEIKFNIGNSDLTINIPHGSYSEHDILGLIDNICKEANEELRPNQILELGCFVDVRINDTHPTLLFPRFEFEVIRPAFSGFNTLDSAGFGEFELSGVTTLNDTIFKSANTPTTNINDSYILFQEPLIMGCGSYQARINTFADQINPADPNGFIIGLTRDSGKLGVNFSEADIDFGIEVQQTTGVYSTIINGVKTATAISPLKFDAGTPNNTHDIIDFTYSNGGVVGTIFQDGVSTQIISEFYEYTAGEYGNLRDPNPSSLYPFICFLAGGNRIILDAVRYHPQTHEVNFQSPDTDPLDIAISMGITQPIRAGSLTDLTLNFVTSKLSKFFGFERITNTINGRPGLTPNGCILSSSIPFMILDSTDVYMVELLNIPLDSYEAFTEQRKNILAVIPVNENNTQQSNFTLQYESPNLNYISIRNEFPFSLRNIRARIVNSRFEQIETAGTSHITIFMRTHRE